jgi:2-polyprenyl-6-methoxyphenol hydroxylase-like FAD-dependent oxidoreductase
LVFEKLADSNLPIKEGPVGARALNIPSIELFYRRGLLPALKKGALKWIDMLISGEGLEVAARGVAPSLDSGAISNPGKTPPRTDSIFGTTLDANVVDYSDPEFAGRGPAAAYGVITVQSLETLLSNRAADLQAEIRRGVGLTAFSADDSGVTVHASGTVVRSGWLVGCDGGRSTVRKLAGFEFPGTDPEICGYSASVEIADPEKLSFGWKRTTKGAYVNGPMPGRILTVEFDGPPKDRDAPLLSKNCKQACGRCPGLTQHSPLFRQPRGGPTMPVRPAPIGLDEFC